MSFNRRSFLFAGLIGIAVFCVNSSIFGQNMESKNTFEIEEMTVTEMQDAMKSGKVTSRQLVEKYLERIKQIDPKLNSILELNPNALSIADKMDRERKTGKLRSMMHGIPVVIKDNIDTADKMKTTAGSLALVDAPTPKQDAFVVRQLREAGAVLIGKTNLSEWANFRSENSSSGWSGRGGQTRNPYILDRSPCGSSSGSGVAVSANLAAVAVGTETDGSVVCPASINGIVGIKPTLGLVSRSGIIPIAHSQDTAGPMARTVTDAAILLNAMVGTDSKDSITSQAKTKGEKDYTEFLDKNGLRGVRIGVVRQYFGKNPGLDSLMEENIKLLEKNGAEIIDVNFPDFRAYGDDEFEVLLYEFKADLNRYLAERGGQYKSLADLIKFNNQNAAKEMPYFKQEIFEKAQEKKDLDDRIYKLALLQSKVLTQEKGIDMVMDKDKLDALLAPSNSQSWLIDLIMGDSPTNYVGSSSLAAVSGYPNITVPSGFLNEMPIGMSFFGRAFSEPTLIKIAYSWEQATKARRKPKYLETYK